MRTLSIVGFLLALLAAPAAPLTYAPATDAELVDGAATIVVGRVVSVQETPTHRYLTVAVDGALKGSPGATVTIEQLGGTEWIVPGAPRTALGDRGVWFLDGAGRADLALGWMRRAGARYVSIDGEARDPERFEAWVGDRAAGRLRPADYEPRGPASVAQPYVLGTLQCGDITGVARWRTHPTWSANDMSLSGTQGSVGWSDLVASAARWSAASAVSVPLSRTSTRIQAYTRVVVAHNKIGLGYTSPPTVTFSEPPPGGRRAAGTAVLADRRFENAERGHTEIHLGTVGHVNLTDAGDYGDSGTPSVTFGAPVANGSISGIRWTSGSGYTSAPAVTVGDAPAGGTRASFTTQISGGEVVDFSATNRGLGYTSAPAISLAAPPEGGTQAEVTIVSLARRTAAGRVSTGPDYSGMPTATHISDTGLPIASLTSTSGTLGIAITWCGTAYDGGNLGPAVQPGRVYVTIVDNFLDYYSADDWRQTMVHEIGHALGLAHTEAAGAIMQAYHSPGRGYHLGDDDIAGIRRLYNAPASPPPGGGDGGGGGDDGDDDSDDDGEAPDPAAPCARHLAPYWHGEAVLILRSANGMSVGVETTCGGATATSTELGDLIVREASCKDEDDMPLVGSLAVTGAAPGGWYYVRGDRNVAAAPLMCASHFEGETVEAAAAGGTTTTRSDRGTFVRHDAAGLIGIVPDLPAGGTGSLRAPYWRGWGGVVGKAVDGEQVEVHYGCEIVPTRERLEADPETGVVSALLQPANCKSEDGRLFVGELKVTGMEDGGWYWLSGPSGGPPAVAPLVRTSLLDEDVQPVDPGNPNVSVERGRYGSLFEHERAALAGVVPHLEE